jgi:hypothetical protein
VLFDLRPGEPAKGQMDTSEGDEHRQSFCKVLEILGKPLAAPGPGEGALDQPPARRNGEVLLRLDAGAHRHELYQHGVYPLDAAIVDRMAGDRPNRE